MTPEFDITMEGMKTMAGWFGSILAWRRAQTAEKKHQAQTALTSLMAAVTETRQYLASVKRDPANHNGTTEDHLAQLWTRAGIDMTAVDGELAIRYLKEADYWSDSVGWSEQQKDERLIQLDDVFELGTRALIPR